MDPFLKAMDDAVASLREQVAQAEQIIRERDAAQAEADRLGRANDRLCDDIAEAGARIRGLEAALLWFADEGHYEGTYRRGAGFVDACGLTRARAALLGMDPDDADAVDGAWNLSRYATEAA